MRKFKRYYKYILHSTLHKYLFHFFWFLFKKGVQEKNLSLVACVNGTFQLSDDCLAVNSPLKAGNLHLHWLLKIFTVELR